MQMSEMKPQILFVGTYTPRKCGIASFTGDLVHALQQLLRNEYDIRVCALDKKSEAGKYTSPVTMVMDGCRLNSCIAGAEAINNHPAVKLVCVEHEFGLFGGNIGEFALGFLSLLNKPFIIRFHTVLPDPDPERLKLIKSICLLADKVVVMTRHSQRLLIEHYGISANKLMIIPHGTHLIPPQFSASLRAAFHLENRKILTTFGLLSPNKGIETGIRAMTRIATQFPEAIYLILGRTHPNLVETEGEAYREYLQGLINEYQLHDNVRLVNDFIPTEQLLSYLALTDIYLFTSRDPNQAVSGTFLYAMSAGCAIISNDFVLAREMLDDETGIIINTGDDKTMAANAIYLLGNDQVRNNMGNLAFMKTRDTLWENVARKHALLFQQMIRQQAPLLQQNDQHVTP
ncbi:glycosyltransferase [Chitinophaga sp. ysch24]|uniref:Glycosyltransferase n=2 Tax=Chitinophaga tropicalis TaxID=2683588 RepID=A0A7K1U3V2_9BACT|nr:glycosyltransferase [Chitinophaga tropicalis]